MRSFPPRLVLVVCAFLVPVAAGDDLDATQPIAAFAVATSPHVLVHWIPGPEPVDYFIVYGVADNVEIPLASSTETSAQVDPGYREYRVAAVRGGTESAATEALVAMLPKCVVSPESLVPPYIYIACNGVRPILKFTLP